MLINLLIIFYLELVMNMKDFFESGIYLSESEKGGRNYRRTAVLILHSRKLSSRWSATGLKKTWSTRFDKAFHKIIYFFIFAEFVFTNTYLYENPYNGIRFCFL